MTHPKDKNRAGNSNGFSASALSFYSKPLKEGVLNDSDQKQKKSDFSIKGVKAFNTDMTCRGFQFSSANSSTGERSANSSTGYSSAAVATGLDSKCMAGEYGCIALQWWNDDEKRCEMKCAEVGCGDGSDGKLKSKIWYQLNEVGEFVEVK